MRSFLLSTIFLLLMVTTLYGSDFTTYVSSFSPNKSEYFFNADCLNDHNEKTGWKLFKSEDKKWIKFIFPRKVVVDSLLVKGFSKAAKPTANVKSAEVSLSGVPYMVANFADSSKLQKIEFKENISESLKVKIESFYDEKNTEFVGFSEIVIKYHEPSEAELAKYKEKLKEKVKSGYSKNPSKDELEIRKKELKSDLKVFFDKYYTAFATLSDEYPKMYSQDLFMQESSTFESFREMIEKRGVLDRYQHATVLTSGLKYKFRTITPTDVELWVEGVYTVIIDYMPHDIHEKSLFHLRKELGEWKISNKMEYN